MTTSNNEMLGSNNGAAQIATSARRDFAIRDAAFLNALAIEKIKCENPDEALGLTEIVRPYTTGQQRMDVKTFMTVVSEGERHSVH